MALKERRAHCPMIAAIKATPRAVDVVQHTFAAEFTVVNDAKQIDGRYTVTRR